MEHVFIQLAVILLFAFIVSYIASLFKQPIIIGYIIAGILISPFIVKFGFETDVINTLSKFGIAFLLFMVGLHLNPRSLKEIGLPSLIIGLTEIIFTFGVSFFIAYQLMDFSVVSSMYIGIAISFSSTILIMKILSDKRDLDSLYAKIAIGVLIVQDLVAAGILMIISSTSNGSSSSDFALINVFIGFGLILALLLAGRLVLPFFTKKLAKSRELLFLFSISWCFIVAAFFNYLGFSIEIGALIAGIALSMTPYSPEISSRISPLRDFFLVIFFLIFGFNADFSSIGSIIVPALIFSLLALILKPIIIMGTSALFGYSKRTNFLAGTCLAQISEFSLIVLFLGVSLGHIENTILQIIMLTMIITIFVSTYMVSYSQKFYEKMKWVVKIFERKKLNHKDKLMGNKYDAILFGYNRIGFSILNSLKQSNKKYLVVDFNPDTIQTLNKFKIPCVYGDVDDVDFLNDLPLDKIKLAVSTVPDYEANLILLDTIRKVNKDAIVIVRAHLIEDALALYKRGADYVVTPHFLGGEYVSKMIGDLKFNNKGYENEREKHINMLKDAAKKGEEHPKG